MHILISHDVLAQSVQLRQQIGQMPQITKISTATTITETYNFAEHQCLDCVVICAAFANLTEFEFLSSLFRIMGIACVVLVDPLNGQAYQPPPSISQRHFTLSEHSNRQHLGDAMRRTIRSLRQSRSCSAIPSASTNYHHRSIILIGASTGGIDALLRCIANFPHNCPPTMIVQHTNGRYANSLVRLLDNATAAQVVPARAGEALEAGCIYLAPDGDRHLCIAAHKNEPTTRLRKTDLVSGHRPSVDALFLSASPFAKNVAAAILTGMGRDGAKGLAKLRQAGAYTIGQDETTSVVYGMPRVAMELGGVVEQLPINEIGPALLHASSAKART